MLSSSSVLSGMNAGWLRPPGAERFGVEHDTGESDQCSAGIDEEAVQGWGCSSCVGEIGRKRRDDAPCQSDRGHEHGEQSDPDGQRVLAAHRLTAKLSQL